MLTGTAPRKRPVHGLKESLTELPCLGAGHTARSIEMHSTTFWATGISLPANLHPGGSANWSWVLSSLGNGRGGQQ